MAHVISYSGNLESTLSRRGALGVYATAEEAIEAVRAVTSSAGHADESNDGIYLYESEDDVREGEGWRATAVVSELTVDTVTDAMIRSLRDAAGQAGDMDQVQMCEEALAGDDRARRGCVLALRDGVR